MTIVSFPGLGIDEFTLNSVALSLFNDKIQIRWYGIFITLGIILATIYTCYRGKKNENVTSDDILDIGLWTVILGVIGARIYYVVTDSGNTYDTFLDVIAIWNGGLAIYGAIIGGMTGIVIGCAIKKVSWKKLFDMAAPGVMIAQVVGRLGNFFNGEAFGYAIGEKTTFFLFNMEFSLNSGEGTFFNFIKMGLNRTENGSHLTFLYGYYHPTFLYEGVWNLLGFILINLFYKKKKYDGQVAIWYFIWYGIGRTVVEGFRTDSLFFTFANLRVSQVLATLFVLAGIVLLVVFGLRHKKASPVLATADGETKSTYQSMFAEVGTDEGVTVIKDETPDEDEANEDEEQETTEEKL